MLEKDVFVVYVVSVSSEKSKSMPTIAKTPCVMSVENRDMT